MLRIEIQGIELENLNIVLCLNSLLDFMTIYYVRLCKTVLPPVWSVQVHLAASLTSNVN